jgi:hypothetical protein
LPGFIHQTERHLALNGPATKEIQPLQGISAAINTAAGDSSNASGSTHHERPKTRGQQIRSVATILFPDLARDLHLLEEIQEGRRSSGLDASRKSTGLGTAASPPDPLVQYLLQRPLHKATPLRQACAPSQTNKDNPITAQRQRFTAEEKKKGIARTPMEEEHSLPQRQIGEGSTSLSWKQQGLHCSHPHTAGSRLQEEAHQQQRQSPLKDLEHATHSRDRQEDEQGSREVKPPYWWRAHAQGKCFNCFSTEHRVAHCRNLRACLYVRKSCFFNVLQQNVNFGFLVNIVLP